MTNYDSRPKTPEEVENLLQKLWTAAVGQPGYDKALWMQLRLGIQRAHQWIAAARAAFDKASVTHSRECAKVSRRSGASQRTRSRAPARTRTCAP